MSFSIRKISSFWGSDPESDDERSSVADSADVELSSVADSTDARDQANEQTQIKLEELRAQQEAEYQKYEKDQDWLEDKRHCEVEALQTYYDDMEECKKEIKPKKTREEFLNQQDKVEQRKAIEQEGIVYNPPWWRKFF